MPDAIKPALTPMQWRLRSWSDGEVDANLSAYGIDMIGADDVIHISPEMRHPIAALARHGQEYGFTWDDVSLLRSLARDFLFESPVSAEGLELGDLADRLQALLPSRESGDEP